MITHEQYEAAVAQKKAAEELISSFHKQKQAAFDERAKNGKPWQDSELLYAAHVLCSCGHGLAYPVGIGMRGEWTCSAVLKGLASPDSAHDGPFPFAFYEIKSEGQPSAHGATTRGVFRPKPQPQEAPAPTA